jgi:hypothetical protein
MRPVLAVLAAFLLACSGALGPPVPKELVEQIAPSLSALGHPAAEYRSSEITGWSAGDAAKHERYVDVAIKYQRPERPAENTMSVRIYQESVEPCRISVDVLEDDGPEPVLLDNSFSSAAIGTEICDALAAQAP